MSTSSRAMRSIPSSEKSCCAQKKKFEKTASWFAASSHITSKPL